MKVLSFFLAILFLGVAIFWERSDQVMPWEHRYNNFLAKVTHRAPVAITAVKMPLVESHLSPQDVALAFRAIVGFHPHEILVLEPIGNFITGPFSLLREAVEKGELQGVPIHFLTSEALVLQKNENSTNLHLISLEDLLLRREESERGSIFPELDLLFSGQTVLLGGPQVAIQAEIFLNKAEKKLMLSPAVESLLLLLLFLLLMKWSRLSWIDFLLWLSATLLALFILDVLLFQFYGKIFPLIAPFMIAVLVFFRKFFLALKK